MYVEVISCFYSILCLKTWVEGTYALNLLLSRFIDIVRMSQNLAQKIYERNVSSASCRRIYWNLMGRYLMLLSS